jgi:hypothetical protein
MLRVILKIVLVTLLFVTGLTLLLSAVHSCPVDDEGRPLLVNDDFCGYARVFK